jgi:transporter family protein
MLKHSDSDSFAFSFIFPVLVSIAIFGYTLVTHSFEFPNLLDVWLNLIIMVIFYAAGSVFIYQAFKQSPAAEVSIIFASSSAWSVLSALMFLGEKLSIPNVLGIVAIILGVIVVNYQKSAWKLETGHLYALIAAFMFGTAFTNDALIINHFHSAPPYVFLAFILPAIGILLYRPSLVAKLPHYFSKEMIGKLLLTATISAISIYTAYKFGGKASIIFPIQQTNIIITVILSYFLLGEKDKLAQKNIGAILVFGGALLLI